MANFVVASVLKSSRTKVYAAVLLAYAPRNYLIKINSI